MQRAASLASLPTTLCFLSSQIVQVAEAICETSVKSLSLPCLEVLTENKTLLWHTRAPHAKAICAWTF
jgi:hypothetical protein